MEPLAIVEAFNKRKDLPTRLIPRVVSLVMDEFIFQGTEEALRHRVVIAIALSTHTRRQAERSELPLIGQTAILCALIGMMDEARSNASLTDGHRQRVQRQVLVRLAPHGPEPLTRREYRSKSTAT